ncbi:SLATT domain-containing protein [Amycolatopsis magusensis]|uniref:SLATT domain-containing protein n=1 Tax=Amycolatopsis magusensis TaxID=882444 RepID=UPI003C3002D7
MFVYNRRKLVAVPLLRQKVALLESRAYSTYRARLEAHKRITRLNISWNTALVGLATSTTVAAVGQLVYPGMYGSGGNALMVVLAVLSLVASLVVSSMNYGARARAMEASYKRIQQISLLAERMETTIPSDQLARRFEELQREYEIAIESSENHVTADHHKAINQKSWETRNQSVLNALPYITLVVPVLLLVPFVNWFFNGI